jgi:signal transduction histidine kinase/CheY-like chemotaxis protein
MKLRRWWRLTDLNRGESVALTVGFTMLLILLGAMAFVVVAARDWSELARSLGNWLSCAVYVLAAAIVGLRAVRRKSKRRSWTVFAVGLSLYGLGNLLWTFSTGELENPPIPSICDALWLTLYPLSYISIVGFARGKERIPAGVWLDGIIVGAGCAAIGAALVFGRVLASVSGSTVAVATELAYPILDLVLAGLVVGVLSLRGWRVDRIWGFLAAGFLLLAVGDCLYAAQVSAGLSNPTAVTNFVYALAIALLAFAAWQPESSPAVRWPERRSVLLMPTGFSLGALGLLVYDQMSGLDPLARGLATATLLASIVRLGFAFADLGAVMRARIAAEQARAESEHQKRQLQERLQRAQRLETVGALAAGVAHDFNNLLAVIINLVGCVSDELPTDSEALSDVKQIGRAAGRAAQLTARLLAFGQPTTGEKEMLNVSEVISDTRTVLERQLGSGVELRSERPAEPWPVHADRNDLEQIVLNLVINAGDAVAACGRITISIENIELDELNAAELDMSLGRYVRLAVSDDGCGMDEDTLARVWDPFFTTKAPGAGTGLGLSSVYGIAQHAGGGVSITSAVGRGTRVEVYLPVSVGHEAEAAGACPSETNDAGRGSILLVDGQIAVREAVRAILEGEGYQVLVADGTRQAIALLAAADRCDLLLTDMVVAGMGAGELVTRARELLPGLPVLFMAGYRDRFLGGDLGSCPGAVLTRPFEPEELLRSVAGLVPAPPEGAAPPGAVGEAQPAARPSEQTARARGWAMVAPAE